MYSSAAHTHTYTHWKNDDRVQSVLFSLGSGDIFQRGIHHTVTIKDAPTAEKKKKKVCPAFKVRLPFFFQWKIAVEDIEEEQLINTVSFSSQWWSFKTGNVNTSLEWFSPSSDPSKKGATVNMVCNTVLRVEDKIIRPLKKIQAFPKCFYTEEGMLKLVILN